MTIILASSPYISFVSNHINFSRKIILPLIPRICIQYVIIKKAQLMYSRNIMLFFPQASSNTNLGPMEACQPLSSRAWNLHEAQRVRKAFLGFWEHFPRKKTLALVLSGLKKQLDKLFLGCCWFLPCFVFVVFVCLWGRMKQKKRLLYVHNCTCFSTFFKEMFPLLSWGWSHMR